MQRTCILALALALLVALAACAGSQHPKYAPVKDADVGRLSPAQMVPVDKARGAVFAARDDAARAKLRLQQAQREDDLAHADEITARAAQERAKTARSVAEESAEPQARAKALEAISDAQLRTQMADDHRTYAKRIIEARQAELTAADARVKAAEAEVERAKLTALMQAQIPAATKYDPAPFDAHVADAQKEAEEADAKAHEALRLAQESQLQWRSAQAQVEARQRGTATSGEGSSGTGSAAGGSASGGTGAGADTGSEALEEGQRQRSTPPSQPVRGTGAEEPNLGPGNP